MVSGTGVICLVHRGHMVSAQGSSGQCTEVIWSVHRGHMSRFENVTPYGAYTLAKSNAPKLIQCFLCPGVTVLNSVGDDPTFSIFVVGVRGDDVGRIRATDDTCAEHPAGEHLCACQVLSFANFFWAYSTHRGRERELSLTHNTYMLVFGPRASARRASGPSHTPIVIVIIFIMNTLPPNRTAKHHQAGWLRDLGCPELNT